ncbi:MAG: methyltransferase domain-containing protein [Candidatus Omnitrophota bacterium]
MNKPILSPPPSHIHSEREFTFGYAAQKWTKYQNSVRGWSGMGMKGPVLDVGAGNGLLTECCLRNGIDCVGLEGSLAGTLQARRRNPDLKMICSIVSPGRPLPFRDGSFQSIIFNQCLSQFSWETIRYAFAESNRLLPKNGLVIITTSSKYFDEAYRPPHNITFFSLNDIPGMLKDLGFTVRVSGGRDSNQLPTGIVVYAWKLKDFAPLPVEHGPKEEWSRCLLEAFPAWIQQAFERFDYEAWEELCRYIMEERYYAPAVLEYGKSLCQWGDFDRARKILKPLLEDKILERDASYWYAQACYSQRDYLQGGLALATAADRNPSDVELRLFQGNCYYYSYQYQKALAIFSSIPPDKDDPAIVPGLISKTKEQLAKQIASTPSGRRKILLIAARDSDLQFNWLRKGLERCGGQNVKTVLESRSAYDLPYDYYYSTEDEAQREALVSAFQKTEFFHFLDLPPALPWIDWRHWLKPSNCLIQYTPAVLQARFNDIKRFHDQTHICGVVDPSCPGPLPSPLFRHFGGWMTGCADRETFLSNMSEKIVIGHITNSDETRLRGTYVFREICRELQEDGIIDSWIINIGESFESNRELLTQCNIYFSSFDPGASEYWALEAMTMGSISFGGRTRLTHLGAMSCPIIPTTVETFADQVHRMAKDSEWRRSHHETARQWVKESCHLKKTASQWLALYEYCMMGDRPYEPLLFD